MLKATFPSLIQRVTHCHFGSASRFSGPTRLRRVRMPEKDSTFLYMNTKTNKAEVVKN
jgi:hypothetical protein